MDKLVYIKELRQASKGDNHWTIVVDQDNIYWPIFQPFTVPAIGKCYLFTFERNAEKNWNDLKKITPIVNIFQQKAVKEVANRNDYKRDFSIATSYSIQLVTAGKIPLESLFEWADKIYSRFQEKADEEMTKLEEK